MVDGVVTHPDHRGQGVASALIAHVETVHQGAIYTTTREAAALFLRRGWQAQRQIDDGWQVLRLR